MPKAADDQSPLERMRKRLYAAPNVGATVPSNLEQRVPHTPTGWDAAQSQNVSPSHVLPPSKPKLSGSLVFLLIAFGFFVLAGGVAAFLLTFGGRSVSTDNIRLSIEGPTTIAGGDTLSVLVTIENRNPVAITGGSLAIAFPPGTYTPDNANETISTLVESIEDIPAGGRVTRTVKAVLFGNEDERVSIPLTFEYRTERSSAVFVKQEQYELTIGTSPVGLNVTSLSEIASGQPLTLSVEVRSNAATPLENLAVVAELPFGFALSSADPAPRGGTLFPIGRLNPGESKEITLTGTLSGQNEDERVFRFNVGTPDERDQQKLGVTYSTKETEVTVTRPFFAVSLLLNRTETEPTIIQTGAAVQGVLSWENTLPSSILDGSLSISLRGTALDTASVSTTNGFYRSSDTTVLFTKERNTALARLEPGDSGTGTFSFRTKTGDAMNALRNPTIILTLSIAGRRVGESSVPEAISSTITRTLKVATNLTLESKGVHSIGPFTNTGPVPPKVDTETTYTILLKAGNTVNSVAGATARMTLPSYVRFTEKTLPSDGSVSYNATTREVVWNVGDLSAGTSKEAAFQIALLPSISQEGTSPMLVGEQRIEGYDRFIERNVVSTTEHITTRIDADPAFTFSQDNVVP